MECPLPQPHYVEEFYMAPKSNFWMSGGYDSQVFRINLFVPVRVYMNYEEMHKLFDIFWSCFYDKGIIMRFHFGKVLPTWKPNPSEKDFEIMRKVRKSYPMFNQWIKFIEREDPYQIFRTKYWKRAFWE